MNIGLMHKHKIRRRSEKAMSKKYWRAIKVYYCIKLKQVCGIGLEFYEMTYKHEGCNDCLLLEIKKGDG